MEVRKKGLGIKLKRDFIEKWGNPGV